MKKKILGPYKVINMGANGNMWEVVEIMDGHGNYSELRPRCIYTNRPSAYGKCRRLNARWQQDNELEEDYDEMLARFA